MTDQSNSSPAGDVTQLLQRWSEGQTDSLDPLFNLVYPRLRQIAAALFRGESPESMLQPTGVVNELFIKLVRQHSLRFENREHFFSLAASLMRRILVDHARSERCDKRDGGIKVPLHDDLVWVSTRPSAELLDMDRALEELQKIDPRKSRMVELRFFLGSTAEETADLLNISKATVDRELKFARGWLYDRLQPDVAERDNPPS
jgi:RNA polymerase sigma factor (TIGR02999 family)